MSSSFFFKAAYFTAYAVPTSCSEGYFRTLSCWKLGLSYTCVLTLKVMDETLSCSSLRSISIMVPQQLFDGTKKSSPFCVTAQLVIVVEV